jgi:hypothetical protein
VRWGRLFRSLFLFFQCHGEAEEVEREAAGRSAEVDLVEVQGDLAGGSGGQVGEKEGGAGFLDAPVEAVEVEVGEGELETEVGVGKGDESDEGRGEVEEAFVGGVAAVGARVSTAKHVLEVGVSADGVGVEGPDHTKRTEKNFSQSSSRRLALVSVSVGMGMETTVRARTSMGSCPAGPVTSV